MFRFQALTQKLDIVLIWLGFLGLLAAAFSWVAKQLKHYNLGWADAIIAGTLVASLIILVTIISLIGWRYFRPLTPRDLAQPNDFQKLSVIANECRDDVLALRKGVQANAVLPRLISAYDEVSSTLNHLKRELNNWESITHASKPTAGPDSEYIEWLREKANNTSYLREIEVSISTLLGVSISLTDHPRYSKDPFTVVPDDRFLPEGEPRQSYRRAYDQLRSAVSTLDNVENSLRLKIAEAERDLRKLGIEKNLIRHPEANS